MQEKEAIRLSKYLNLVLRHKPDLIGIALDAQGWTDVNLLLQKMHSKGISPNQAMLEQLVETNTKKRFAFNADKTKIRASQGHSVPVDLGYAAVKPPTLLYHGTGAKAVSSILREGLLKGKRHHVHLSADAETAIQVGKRHGSPVVIGVEALKMYEHGHRFLQSQNGEWLTAFVPATYLYVLTT